MTVSTAHKAKGREWARVKIADDFTPPPDSDQQDDTGCALPGPIDDGEARLAYVAVTRTRRCLDLGGLSWINQHPDGGGVSGGPAPVPGLSVARFVGTSAPGSFGSDSRSTTGPVAS
ncbi:hypothetical protein [Streptomyces sp. NPDC088554]|uniref:hypothetical protein n=1 Tax=Streptomyces sp. NPDC088554 TaxID=3365865 RepID=UPI0037F3DC68